MICFHFSIFEVSETSQLTKRIIYYLLWFAFILVSLKYRKHLTPLVVWPVQVVICFHFSIFEVSETSRSVKIITCIKLWFAFILVSLKYRKHQVGLLDIVITGCDLLSCYYLWSIGNIGQSKKECLYLVVICFHFSIFEVSETSPINQA